MLAVMEKVGSYSRTLEGESTLLCYDEGSFCHVCKHSHLWENLSREPKALQSVADCVQASGSVVCSVW